MGEGLYICRKCRSVGEAPTAHRPKTRSVIVSLLLTVRPGLRYLLHGRTKMTDVCGVCGQPDVVVIQTRHGRKLVKLKIRILPELARKHSND